MEEQASYPAVGRCLDADSSSCLSRVGKYAELAVGVITDNDMDRLAGVKTLDTRVAAVGGKTTPTTCVESNIFKYENIGWRSLQKNLVVGCNLQKSCHWKPR